MPRTRVEDVARRVISEVGTEDNWMQAVTWVSDRFRELCRKARFRQLRKVGYLTLPARINTGTVTVARGEGIVVGDASARTVWSNNMPDLLGRYIRVRVAWYEIIGKIGNDLLIDGEFAEDSVTAGGYDIVKRNHILPAEVRNLGDFYQPRLRRKLVKQHAEYLDYYYPDRSHVAGILRYVAEVRVDEDAGARVIEIYPPPTETEQVAYVYYKDAPELREDDYLPNFIDADMLKEGALVNVLRWKAAQAADEGKAEAAAFYLNWAKTQQTKWERDVIPGAIKDGRGSDDLVVILEGWAGGERGQGGEMVRDIKNARDEIWSRGGF